MKLQIDFRESALCVIAAFKALGKKTVMLQNHEVPKNLPPVLGFPTKFPSQPPQQGLYNSRFEHDACGIGFVAHIEGRRSHAVLEMGLEALCNHAHRGAVADDRKTGDGAGILTQLPYEFFKRELLRLGIQPPVSGDLAVGQLFLFRQDADDREHARRIIRAVCSEFGLEVLTYRSVPVVDGALGRRAEASRPWMEQVCCAARPKRVRRVMTMSVCSIWCARRL